MHNTYRPTTFDEVIGNKETIDSLKNLLSLPFEKRVPMYTFSGPLGSGKTSLAYIVAKELGGVRKGIDLIEINASSDRGINTARDVIEEASTPSLLTKIKVFLFEECNNITKEAARALLTITERPPAGVYFIVTTLFPENMEPALLSRGVHYKLKQLNRDESLTLLKKVVRAENIQITKQSIELLLEYAQGTPRTLLIGLNTIRGCKTVVEARSLLTEFEVSQNQEIIQVVRGIADTMNLGLFQDLLRKSHDMFKAKPEECRIVIGRYLAKIALSPSNTVYMKELGQIVSLFSEPAVGSGGDIKLISSIIEAYDRMSKLRPGRKNEQ